MTAQDIITQITTIASKANADHTTPDAQLGQLAAVMQEVLRDCGLVKTNDLIAFRKGIQGLVAGVTIKSSKNLPYGFVIAMVSRWCDEMDPYTPTDAARQEIPILMRELAIRNGQQELM